MGKGKYSNWTWYLKLFMHTVLIAWPTFSSTTSDANIPENVILALYLATFLLFSKIALPFLNYADFSSQTCINSMFHEDSHRILRRICFHSLTCWLLYRLMSQQKLSSGDICVLTSVTWPSKSTHDWYNLNHSTHFSLQLKCVCQTFWKSLLWIHH